MPSVNLKDVGLITMIVTVIGTTIAPWMQFYQQSAVAEKKILIKEYQYEVWDTYAGAFITEFVAFFIVLATAATLYKNGIVIVTAADAARALIPLAGRFAGTLFAFGLVYGGYGFAHLDCLLYLRRTRLGRRA
jgi:Mn2+/Fe2+ NRAMP family transporter